MSEIRCPSIAVQQSPTVVTPFKILAYKDTGVQLTVSPSVNAGGLVTLDVLQTVTDVGQIDVTGNRRFLERSIESRVAVRSGESVVLGGLIRENCSEQRKWRAMVAQGSDHRAAVWHHRKDARSH